MRPSHARAASQTCVVADFYGKSYYDGTQLVEPSSQMWTSTQAYLPACASCDSICLSDPESPPQVDFATKSAQIRADFANVVEKQRVREQEAKEAKEQSSWMFEGKRRMVLLRNKFSENRISRIRVVDVDN